MIKWCLTFLICLPALAAPLKLEVWFLSAHKKAALLELLNQKTYVLRPLTAELQCQEMGDYCFDPQFGLYKKEHISDVVDVDKVNKTSGPTIPVENTVDRSIVNCDSTNYFDIFCGKARKDAKAPEIKFDLWIDTSSSMREMDFSDKEGGCFRKSMLKRLDETCGFNQKVNVMMFDTSIKQAGSMDSLCQNQGLNDQKRLMDWIERSDSKHLVIISDIYEFHKDFADYVESKNGIFRGDKDPLTAAQLVDLVPELAKNCR